MEAKINAHRERFGEGRKVISMKMRQSITLPQDHLFIAIDDMDNNKSVIPKQIESGKKLSNLNKID